MRAISDLTEGQFELIPVELSYGKGGPYDYPMAACLLDSGLDIDQLKKDFSYCDQHFSHSYIEDRLPFIGSTYKDMQDLFQHYGFTPEAYRAIGLMRLGTNQWIENTPSYTKQLVEKFSPFCRVHYAIASTNFNLKPHKDCHTFEKHGFRIHIPISQPAHYHFYSKDGPVELVLKPGSVWFVNNALQHAAFNPYNTTRVSLLLQVMTDTIFNNIKSLELDSKNLI